MRGYEEIAAGKTAELSEVEVVGDFTLSGFLIHQSPEVSPQAFQSGAAQEVFVYPELYRGLNLIKV